MNIKTVLGTALLSIATVAGAAAADNPQTTSGRLANRIVGAYQTEAQVRDCGSGGPDETVINTIIFNQGGTVVAMPQFPPQGANGYSRTIDMGTWSYDPRTGRYSVNLRFYGFVDGELAGTSTVEREVQMSNDNNTVSGPVHVTTVAPDGSVIAEVCGIATSTRL